MSELDIINELIDYLLDRDLIIIVEGKRDAQALKAFGLKKIHYLKKSLADEAEIISKSAKEVFILTDLDKEGIKIHKTLSQYLINLSVKVDDSPRNLLRQTEIRQVQGLWNRYSKLVTQ